MNNRIQKLLQEAKQIAEEDPKYSINSPDNVASLVLVDMMELNHEEFWVLLLDTRNKVTDIIKLYRGNLNSITLRIGEIFRDAIRMNSASIIPVHNHPSGDPYPSPEDIVVTQEMIKAGNILDIDVLDHIVIGNGSFISMRSKKLANFETGG